MTRTPAEIAESLYARFEDSSADFQQELYPYNSGRIVSYPAAKQKVDAALSAFAAALGSEQEESLAVAGCASQSREGQQECELVVFTYGLLLHASFSLDADAGAGHPEVQIIPRSSLVSLSIKAASPYNQPTRPDRLQFSAVYENGLVLDFPLKGNRANNESILGNVLDLLRTDLKNK
ncbi:hypothetical protein [Pseudarthrobacter equi]|uniref:hypothetical protein n=1 Tax=Pseudarthrobacter equi TaxID=728066 RepID=UPI0012FD9A68|nr:hypothetical protein [Pseudarthrobacter equi]